MAEPPWWETAAGALATHLAATRLAGGDAHAPPAYKVAGGDAAAWLAAAGYVRCPPGYILPDEVAVPAFHAGPSWWVPGWYAELVAVWERRGIAATGPAARRLLRALRPEEATLMAAAGAVCGTRAVEALLDTAHPGWGQVGHWDE